MAPKNKANPKTKKVGRNDPCPCGSGKKYKQCCLLKEKEAARERHAAERVIQLDSEPEIHELSPVTTEAAEPAASTTEDDPLDLFWNDFKDADYEGKIALFYQVLEDEEIKLDGQIVFDMFDVLYRETLERDERDRFDEMVHALRQATPELYAEEQPYLLGWVVQNAIAADREEDVAEGIRKFSTIADNDIDLYIKALDQLEYHGYLDLLTEAATIAWPQIKESKNIMAWGIDDFAESATNYHIFQYLERHPQARGDEPELLTRLNTFADPDPDRLRHYFDWVTGRQASNWTEADFAHQNKQFSENLHHLSLEFLDYLRREKQIPYTKAEQACDGLTSYFFRRHGGTLKVDKKNPKIRHPLCPDTATLDSFLGKLLQLLSYQIFKAAAIFELIPAWLEFLRTRELVTDAISTQTLQGLKPLHEPLLKIYRSDKSDPALFEALENWPYQGS